jgi:pimeloyl-ACP methyl ester carboxylesterase
LLWIHNVLAILSLQVWCLNSQIEHKVLLLRQHVLAAGKPPSVIVAHSIGSYIMLQAIKRLEEEAAAAGTAAEYADKIPKVSGLNTADPTELYHVSAKMICIAEQASACFAVLPFESPAGGLACCLFAQAARASGLFDPGTAYAGRAADAILGSRLGQFQTEIPATAVKLCTGSGPPGRGS